MFYYPKYIPINHIQSPSSTHRTLRFNRDGLALALKGLINTLCYIVVQQPTLDISMKLKLGIKYF